MNLDPRTERTVLFVGGMFLAVIVAVLITSFVPNLNPQLSAAIIGLAITACVGLTTWITNSTHNAAPSVAAVDKALPGDATVTPPSAKVEK